MYYALFSKVLLFIAGSYDILMLSVAIYAIRTATLPTWVIGKNYKAEGKSIRLLGFIMLVPSIAGFFSGFIVGYKSFGDPASSSSLIELAVTLQVAMLLIITFIGIIIVMENRKPLGRTSN